MTIRRGEDWGSAAGPLPPDGVVAHSDAEARAVVEEARRTGEKAPPIGLAGGDLWRTFGSPVGRLHTDHAMTFTVDLGEALVDGRLHLFCAHLVARGPWWRGQGWCAMNAAWLGDWNLAPRSHPNDGLLDVLDARLRPSELLAARRRARTGAHVPHPRIAERRVPAVQTSFQRPTSVWLDGVAVGDARHLSVRVEPDALTIVV